MVESPGFISRLKQRSYDILVVAIAIVVLWGIALLAFYYLFNIRQDLIVNGTYVTIATTLFVFLSSRIEQVKRLYKKYFSSTLLAIDRHRGLLTALLVPSVLAALLITINMFSEYKDRYSYVKLIQSAVKSDVFESVNVPDPNVLAESFLLAPSRPESALLLIRASRIFFLADDADRFRQYQREFVGSVVEAIDNGELNLCHESSDLYDPAVFIALVNAETAYTTDAVNTRENKPPTPEQINKAVEWSLNLLKQCEEESIDRSLYILKLKDAISGNNPRPAYIQNFNVTESVVAFTEKVEHELSSAKAVNFYRRHAYQEYVDFLAYLTFSRILSRLEGATADESGQEDTVPLEQLMDEVIINYRKVLMLRLRLASAGSVIWHTTPSKLTLYHWFAERFGFSSHVSRGGLVKRLNGLPWSVDKQMLEGKLEELLDASAFSVFRNPREWAKSSPLDYELEGQSLVDKLDAWLLDDW